MMQYTSPLSTTVPTRYEQYSLQQVPGNVAADQRQALLDEPQRVSSKVKDDREDSELQRLVGRGISPVEINGSNRDGELLYESPKEDQDLKRRRCRPNSSQETSTEEARPIRDLGGMGAGLFVFPWERGLDPRQIENIQRAMQADYADYITRVQEVAARERRIREAMEESQNGSDSSEYSSSDEIECYEGLSSSDNDTEDDDYIPPPPKRQRGN